MDLGLKAKKAFVTGGSAGIGQAIVRTLAAEGADVAFTYHNAQDAAEDLVAELATAGVAGHAIQMDVRVPSSVLAATEAAIAALGQVDVLVNNALAKRNTLGPDAGSTLTLWQHSILANLEGPYLVTDTVMPGMRARKWGRIVSISSDLAEDGSKGSAPYSTAKAGLHGMTRGLCWELGPDNVLINIVMPGLTSSDNQLGAVPAEVFDRIAKGRPTGRITTPQEVADIVVFLGSGRNTNITGEFVRVTGGT